MSTDITVEPKPETTLSFDDFTRDQLPLVARAVQFVAETGDQADAALTAGTLSVFQNWAQQLDAEHARQHVFGEAIRHHRRHRDASADCGDVATEPDDITSTAVSIAHHVFDWNAAATMAMLGLTANQHFDQVGDQEEGARLRAEVAQASPARVDLPAITERNASSRRRAAGIAVGAIVALLLIGALAQRVAGPEPAQDPGAVSVAFERPSFPGENVSLEPSTTFQRPVFPGERIDLEQPRPTSQRFLAPSLIIADRTNGFIGIRPPNVVDDATIAVSSSNGSNWKPASSWDLAPNMTVTRFEWVGDGFAIWLEHANTPDRLDPLVAISKDLETWTTLDLNVDEPQPVGLKYRSEVLDLAMKGDQVLVLLRTEVEIDFPALSLGEAYTCGHSITDDAVTVDQCNSEIDVLSFGGVQELPAPSRLFISSNGQPFQPSAAPFDRGTTAGLTTVNGAFAIYNDTRLQLATSTDGLTWLPGADQGSAIAVPMSAANEVGQVLWAGEDISGQPFLFFNGGSGATGIGLRQIVAQVSNDATVLVASTPTRWATYVYQPDGRAWIASSDDGLNWAAAEVAPPDGTDVRFIASDDTALVQSIDGSGESFITAIALPEG